VEVLLDIAGLIAGGLLGDIAARLLRPRVPWRLTFSKRALLLALFLVLWVFVGPRVPLLYALALPLAGFLVTFLSGLDERVQLVGPWWAFWKRAVVR